MQQRRNMWVRGLLGAVLGLGFWLVGGRAASAADYPYAAMPCVHAPYAVSGSRTGWCHDYDWGVRPGDESRSSVISPYGYYYRNCTDYAAWWLTTHNVPPHLLGGLGDAKHWVAASGRGVPVDGTPAVGAVGVRLNGTYGHLAIVEATSVPGYPAGTIKVSEYNRRGTGVYGERIGTPAQLRLDRFVHFEAFVPAPAPAIVEPVPAVDPPITPEAVPSAAPTPTDATQGAAPEKNTIDPAVSNVQAGAPLTTEKATDAPDRRDIGKVSEGESPDGQQGAGYNADASPGVAPSAAGSEERSMPAEESVPTPTTTLESAEIVAFSPATDISQAQDLQDVSVAEPSSLQDGPSAARPSIPHQWWLPNVLSPPVANTAAVLPMKDKGTHGAWLQYGVLTGLVLILVQKRIWTMVWRRWHAWRTLTQAYNKLGG